jgi:perosamine synthetase
MIELFTTFISPKAHQLVGNVLDSTFLSEGSIVKDFESALKAQLYLTNPVAVNSGTSSLHLALLLAGVSHGDEVILPAQTFIASGLTVMYCGAKPIFADVQYETGNICPKSIESKITERTRAIMVVHWAGTPCDLDEIHEVASRFNLPIIEDAAHALGASYKGKPVGTISDFTCFSFQAIKHVSTGDGGALCIRSNSDFKRALELRWFGINREDTSISCLGERIYNAKDVGFKYHLNNYSAALGLANLEGFPQRLEKVRRYAGYYDEQLQEIPGITLFDRPKDRLSSYWLYGMHVQNRLEFIGSLRARGVAASVVHQRIDRNSVFGNLNEDLIGQEMFDATQVHIPLHSKMSESDLVKVVSAIKEGW